MVQSNPLVTRIVRPNGLTVLPAGQGVRCVPPHSVHIEDMVRRAVLGCYCGRGTEPLLHTYRVPHNQVNLRFEFRLTSVAVLWTKPFEKFAYYSETSGSEIIVRRHHLSFWRTRPASFKCVKL